MKGMNRREFLQYLSALGVSAVAAKAFWDSSVARAEGSSSTTPVTVPTNTGISGNVVVVGGGMGGASVAKFLRVWGGTGVNVTLVERDPKYTSNILSNLVLNGQKTIPGLQYAYANLTSRYGVKVVQGNVTAIGPSSVTLSGGTTLPFDRVVVAPGVDFDALPGLSVADYDTRFPHAWRAGPQTTLLRNQLLAMPAGGTFVMTIPAAPYRCPPGPYERACVVADWLKKNKPGSKVIILDANPKIMAEPEGFNHAFTVVHAGVITYVPNAAVTNVDAANKTVVTTAGSYKFSVFNPIPPHRAGKIAVDAGLVPAGGKWAPVDVLTYESTLRPKVHVIGDAMQSTQPKAGHIANAEAKVTADAILNLLAGRQVNQAPVTNSACYSPITATTASWLTAVFQYDPATKTMKAVKVVEAPPPYDTTKNYSQMFTWFGSLMSDTFA